MKNVIVVLCLLALAGVYAITTLILWPAVSPTATTTTAVLYMISYKWMTKFDWISVCLSSAFAGICVWVLTITYPAFAVMLVGIGVGLTFAASIIALFLRAIDRPLFG
ncbi:MAG: hypothetical protein ACJKSS_01370 [Patescibacteria group bacterium UBA2103]